MIEWLNSSLGNPVVLIGIVAIIAIWLWPPKDTNGDGNPDITLPLINKRIEIDQKLVEKAQAALTDVGMSFASELLGSVMRGDSAAVQTQAEHLAEELRSGEGRRFRLRPVLKRYIQDVASANPEELASLVAELKNRVKDLEDSGKRNAANPDLHASS